MKNNIPKSFRVFASIINIDIDNERLSNKSCLGDCSFTDSKITLCNSYKGQPMRKYILY